MMKDELFVSPVCLEDEEDEEDKEESSDIEEEDTGDDSEPENEYGDWNGDSE